MSRSAKVPWHGHGQGHLVCVDAATGREIWTSRRVDRSLATPAIHEGLLFVPDLTGRLHCLNAETGAPYWQHDLEADIWGASALVVGDKVYASTERRELWVFRPHARSNSSPAVDSAPSLSPPKSNRAFSTCPPRDAFSPSN